MAGSDIPAPVAILRSLLVGIALLGTAPPASAQQPSPTAPTPLETGRDPSVDARSPTATVTSISTSVSVSTETATATTTTTESTRIVSIFYLDERAFEGLPYTLLHRVCGHAVGADDTATTFVITTTRMDLRASTHTRTDNITTAIPTLKPTRSWTGGNINATGQPSTITQGPETFLFTGTRWGDPSRTIVNRCRLNGTGSARCNLTHVGEVWYTGDPAWNGTFSTYNYTWTSGDRYGFAPCTVTRGVEVMGPPTLTATTSTNGGGRGGGGGGGGGPGRVGEMGGLVGSVGLVVAFVFGLFLLV